MLFSQGPNWNLVAFLSKLSHFDLEHDSYKQIYNKNKINKAFKILK